MIYGLYLLLLTAILELVFCRGMCGVIAMRSDLLYYVLHMLCYAASWTMRWSGTSDFVRSVTIITLTMVVLPLALSQGRMRARVLRMLLIDMCIVITEPLGSFMYSALTGGSAYPMAVTSDTFGAVSITYAVLILASAVETQLVIVLCRRFDQDQDADLEAPVLALMLGSIGLVTVQLYRFYVPVLSSGYYDTRLISVMVVYCICEFVLSLALVPIARNDAQLKRQIAERAATVRQDKRVRDEVRAATRRSLGMRRLRHDLANQMGVVGELVAQGRADDADRYLAALQTQAHKLTEAVHE